MVKVGKMNAVFLLVLGLALVSCKGDDDAHRHEVEDKLHVDLLETYQKHILPYPKSGSHLLIEFSPPIISISNLDASTQTLNSELFLKLAWHDSRLVWNPDDYLGIEFILVHEYKLWKPDIQLLNSVGHSNFGRGSDILALVHHNGQVVWSFPAKTRTHCEVNLRHFPFDVHTCRLKFGSWTHDGSIINVDLHPSFTENPFYSGFDVAGEWQILSSEVNKTMNLYDCCNSSWPDVSFYFTVGRLSPLHQVTIFCPLSAVVILLLTSFWMSPLKSERLTANFIVLVMLVLITLHLSWKLPAVSHNVPLIMIFSGATMLLSAVATTATLLLCNLGKSRPHPVILQWKQARWFKMASRAFCVSIPSSFNSLVDQDNQFTLTENEISKNAQMALFHPEELWTPLFQIIDRLSFILCTIVVVVMLAKV